MYFARISTTEDRDCWARDFDRDDGVLSRDTKIC